MSTLWRVVFWTQRRADGALLVQQNAANPPLFTASVLVAPGECVAERVLDRVARDKLIPDRAVEHAETHHVGLCAPPLCVLARWADEIYAPVSVAQWPNNYHRWRDPAEAAAELWRPGIDDLLRAWPVAEAILAATTK